MKRILQMTAAAGLALSLTMGVSMAAEPIAEAKKLEAMATAAKTPAEHASVSRQYRLRAESFEAKAAVHEAEAKKLSERPRHAMDYKWPAMTNSGRDRERRLAMEARRAAQECYAIAERHAQRAVEAQFAAE
ncbi:MAG: hypothetical protein SFV51_17960 [Bryobacteraceae bacterium]|nr:hypothetical protein [Bryobacteraceae bacterium]